jgi:hypothetical protein
MLILGNDWEKAYNYLFIQLRTKGLHINQKKTMMVDSNNPYKFLGFKICGKDIRISEDKYNKFKSDINSLCKYSKSNNLSTIIRRINNYLFRGEHKRMDLIFRTVSVREDIVMLDRYVKSRIRYAMTGKNNSIHNCNRISDGELRDSGYKSLVMLYDIHKQGSDVFNQFLDVEVL